MPWPPAAKRQMALRTEPVHVLREALVILPPASCLHNDMHGSAVTVPQRQSQAVSRIVSARIYSKQHLAGSNHSQVPCCLARPEG